MAPMAFTSLSGLAPDCALSTERFPSTLEMICLLYQVVIEGQMRRSRVDAIQVVHT